MLSLEDFEFSVSSHIKERGWTYFHHGAVKDLQQIGEGHWHAIVFGSAEYEVSVQMTGTNIDAMHCDCPYDYGPVCKHQVAMLYGIKAALDAGQGAVTENSPRAALNASDQLERLTNEELRAFVKHLIEQDWEFKNRFMLYFADSGRATDIRTNYKKAVRKLIGNQVSNRKEYRDLAVLLLKVKADIVNSQQTIEELASMLLARYPRRSAMKAELSTIFK
ncbi:MAG: SWIM zinc finger domain-containing protein [Phaeodactylibacter xiamenensis]|uniref:SWIM-type domain-containing protein n=1 Tax=Phaeodactylibacter xiamenensis TaxID=1524460 RepID=A0A098S661_9BACT|nr:hypothetical protein [Phaeodactylibacter xiamenensis]KGE87600.1 hypothetical protein IX84_13695 [Phaeodactylibacter xiamenensis]MCR9055225.1 hypothetical protein [bacterium]